MHACIVRITCRNKAGGGASIHSFQVAGLQLHLCCCGTATHVAHASRSPPKILDTPPSDGAPIQHCPRSTGRLCSAFPSQSSFVSSKLSSLSIGIAHFSTTQHFQTFRSAEEKFWPQGGKDRGTARRLAYQATYPWGPWRYLRTWWAWFLRVCWGRVVASCGEQERGACNNDSEARTSTDF